MKEYNLYQQEQNKLLYDFLIKEEQHSNSIEFIISSYCNQSCEYCYIHKHGNELFPKESDNFNNIINNFKILLNWLNEQNFTFKHYDIFSGDFFNLPIWEDIFEIIYNNEQQKKREEENRSWITIPTNGSFLIDEKKIKKVENWMQKFKNINVDCHISFSIDGPEDLEKIERPLNSSQQKENNFYKNLIIFQKKYSFAGHPMITKNFVKNYKKNYDWWIDTIINNNITQFNINNNEIYCIPMFLEVRDAEQWDEESLKNYKEFLKYVAKKDLFSYHNNNINDFAYHFFQQYIDEKNIKNANYIKVQPYIINYPYLINKMPCSIQHGPVFRVGDLAYVPCHRTMYSHFVYGYFIKENDKIIGIEANKPTLAIKIKNLNPNRSVLKCADCPIRSFCLKGCLGSQYEHTNELFCADERICDLYYIKYKTIHEIALEYNLYDWVEKNPYFSLDAKEGIKYVRAILEKL